MSSDTGRPKSMRKMLNRVLLVSSIVSTLRARIGNRFAMFERHGERSSTEENQPTKIYEMPKNYLGNQRLFLPWENYNARLLPKRSLSKPKTLWHVVQPCTFLKSPPLGLTGTCHFYCRRTPAGRETGILGSAWIGSVSIAPRRVFRAHDTSTSYPGITFRIIRHLLSSEGLLVTQIPIDRRSTVSVVQLKPSERKRVLHSLGVSFIINNPIVNRVPKVPRENGDVTKRTNVRVFHRVVDAVRSKKCRRNESFYAYPSHY
ncbi:hypothetical protein G5I_06506 [Acromyrmex echinatior]|uniref:Uncharacterized protein n=1 Tax=Acromyrmex echinatior TaxID=103372 RepID=F4WL82_ACREC|nr:hypothetical protein G5I_06506 [Acromyrmex echinatior]